MTVKKVTLMRVMTRTLQEPVLEPRNGKRWPKHIGVHVHVKYFINNMLIVFLSSLYRYIEAMTFELVTAVRRATYNLFFDQVANVIKIV